MMIFVVERRVKDKWKSHGWVKKSPDIHAALRVVKKSVPMWDKRVDNFRLKAIDYI